MKRKSNRPQRTVSNRSQSAANSSRCCCLLTLCRETESIRASRCFRFIRGIPRTRVEQVEGHGLVTERGTRGWVAFFEVLACPRYPQPLFDVPGYFAFCYIIAGFDYAKRLPSSLLSSFFLSLITRYRITFLPLP